MAKELSGSIGKMSRRAVLKSIQPIGYYANPVPIDDTTLRDLPYNLGDLATSLGFKPGEEFDYDIIVRKRSTRKKSSLWERFCMYMMRKA